MSDTIHDDAKKVYEIGYLLISSVPEEKIAGVTATLQEVLSKKKAEIIGEEAPELIPLAYTMIKKIGTANHRFDEAYFGWVKFEMAAGDIEEVKKTLDLMPEMLRFLLITTVKENTYLGEKAIIAKGVIAPETAVSGEVPAEAAPVEVKATTEDIDKSIDEMVKGA
jgi:ribosomal protein S6